MNIRISFLKLFILGALSLLFSSNSLSDEIFSKHYSNCSKPQNKKCNKQYDPNSIEQKWYELEFMFINRQTKIQNDLLVCTSRVHKNCVKMANQKAAEERAEKGLSLSAEEQQRLGEAESRAEELYEGNVKWRTALREQIHSDNMKALTFGLSEVNTNCGFQSTVGQTARVLADTVLESVSMLCEQGAKAAKPLFNELESFRNKLEDFGLAPNQLLEGKGINAGIFAQLGIGANSSLEAVVHGRGKHACMGVMCVAGAQAVTAAGAGVALSGVYTMGCKNNWDYLGSFLGVGVTFEYGVGVEATYNFGVNHHALHKFVNGTFPRDNKLYKETMEKSNQEVLEFMDEKQMNDENKLSWLLLMKLIDKVRPLDKATMDMVNRKLANDKGMAEKFKEWIELNKNSGNAEANSLGGMFKRVIGSMAQQKDIPPSLKQAYLGATTFLTGCDSIAAGASIGPSAGAGPVLKLTEYSMAGELPVDDLEYVASSLIGGPALVGALSCVDKKRFKEKMNNIMGRLADIKNNVKECMNSSSQAVFFHAERLAHMARGNYNFEIPPEYSDYNKNYQKTHPHHKPCSCGKATDPQCPSSD